MRYYSNFEYDKKFPEKIEEDGRDQVNGEGRSTFVYVPLNAKTERKINCLIPEIGIIFVV